MKPRLSFLIFATSCIFLLSGSRSQAAVRTQSIDADRAQMALDSLYKHFSVDGTTLLRETYPFDEKYLAGYLAENAEKPNPYSYLWPYSGTFSAVSALNEVSMPDTRYAKMLDKKVLPGIELYFDKSRKPFSYSSYINSAPASDRFYDDNVWIGIDFTDSYLLSGRNAYLKKAELIWKFIESGMDDQLGGGIYWCEQKKHSKNTCSNAPGSVYALKLFLATKDSSYFKQGKGLYDWTKSHLQDSTDNLYFDNMSLKGKIGRAKFAYNTGQMLQAASLLYKITGDSGYLTEAQALAKACYGFFFEDFVSPEGDAFKLLKKDNIWFTAVMFRGFIELYKLDRNPLYIDAFRKNLDYAWKNARDENGLFYTDWSGRSKDKSMWLLTQAAMVEMYARLATIDHN